MNKETKGGRKKPKTNLGIEQLTQVISALTPDTKDIDYDNSQIKETNILNFSQQLKDNLTDYSFSVVATYNNIINNSLEITINLSEFDYYFEGCQGNLDVKTINESDIVYIFNQVKPLLNILNKTELGELVVRVDFRLKELRTLPYRHMNVDLNQVKGKSESTGLSDFYESFTLKDKDIYCIYSMNDI